MVVLAVDERTPLVSRKRDSTVVGPNHEAVCTYTKIWCRLEIAVGYTQARLARLKAAYDATVVAKDLDKGL